MEPIVHKFGDRADLRPVQQVELVVVKAVELLHLKKRGLRPSAGGDLIGGIT